MRTTLHAVGSLVAVLAVVILVALLLTGVETLKYRAHCVSNGGTFVVDGPDLRCPAMP